MKKSVACVFSGCALISAALTAASLGTHVWASLVVEVEGVIVESTIGLFQVCAPLLPCIAVSEDKQEDYVKATQAFLVIAALLLVANFIYCLFVSMKKASAKSIGILFGLAAICTLIAMAVYTAKNEFVKAGFSYGYSYILGWFVFGFDLICFPVALILAKRSDYSALP